MSDSKIIKNRLRTETVPQAKPYVPQYVLKGIEPEQVNFAPRLNPGSFVTTRTPLPLDNPRGRSAITQPYADAPAFSLGTAPVPNVGNNMEHSWSGVDGAIVDDISIDSNHPMIDNNNFEEPGDKPFLTRDELQEILQGEETQKILHQTDNQYILMVKDVVVCVSSLEEVQKQTQALLFGEHRLCGGECVLLEDIMILKKMKIKVGVFIE